MIFTESHHIVPAVTPVADAFAGTLTTDVFSLKDWQHITFVFHTGAGATGTSTFTVEACDDTTPSNTSAIPFHYREMTTIDTLGALTRATSSGFTSTAGANRLVILEVDADELAADGNGYGYIRAKAVEQTDSPVLGGAVAIFSQGRYQQSVPTTVIT